MSSFSLKRGIACLTLIAGICLPLASAFADTVPSPAPGTGAPASGFLQGNLLHSVSQGTGLPGSNSSQQTASGQFLVIVGNIINVVLSVLGLFLLVYLIYAGFLWMTSGGDTKGVTKAKDMIKNAIIGIVIITVSATATSFIIGALANATLPTSSGPCVSTPGAPCP